MQARDLIEDELGRKLSLRELTDSLKEYGYSIGRTAINALVYAIEELYPALPELLEEGAGKPVVERIRKIEGQLKEIWKQIEQPEESFKKVFNESLKEAYTHSERGIDTDEIFRAFEAEAALSTGVDINSIRVKIAQLLDAKDPVKKAAEAIPKKEQAEEPGTEDEEQIDEETVNKESVEAPVIHEDETEKQGSGQSSPQESSQNITQEAEQELSEQADKILGEAPEEETVEEDIYLLREIALKQAVLLAEECGIEDLVIKLDRGFGWALADMPQEIHFTNCGIDDSKPEFQRTWQIWFGLYQFCGATLGNALTNYSDVIAHENDLKALVEERFEEISDLGQYISTVSLSYTLPVTASDVLFNKLNQLQIITRKIMAVAGSQNTNLWEVAHG